MDLFTLIAQIHTSPLMAVIVVTGGGSQALADLLAVPGASKTLLEALVPYSDRSLQEFLGEVPQQAVSVETAAALARVAHQRARKLDSAPPHVVLGLSCTATLVTDRPKKGEHRAHIGLCTEFDACVHSLTLTKGARNRQAEERVVSNLLLSTLADACGVKAPETIGLLAGEQILVTSTRIIP